MSERLGEAVLELRTDDRKFNRGMGRAEGRTKRLTRQFRETAKRAALVGSALTAVAVGGLAKFISAETAAIDKTAKLGRQIGETTANIQGLRLAADLTGAGASKLSEGLEVLQKRLGEVATKGTGAAADSLEALGLRVEDIINLNPAEQFRVIADRMAGLANQAERNGVAANLFSRANQRLVLTLMAGREELDETQKLAERLGLTYSEETARGAEAFQDELTLLGRAMEGFRIQAASQLQEPMRQAVELITRGFMQIRQDASDLEQDPSLTQWAEKTITLFALVADAARSASLGISEGFGFVGETLGAGTAQLVEVMRGNFREAGLIGQEWLDDQEARGERFANFNARLFRDMLREIRENAGEASQEIRRTLAEGVDLGAGMDGEGVAGGAARASSFLRPVMQTIERIREEQNAMLQEGRQLWERTRTPVEAYNLEIERLNRLYARGAISAEVLERASVQAAIRMREEMEEAGDATEEMSEFAVQAARNMQSAFADFLFDPFEDGLKGMLDSFSETLRRMVAEAASQQLLNAVLSAAGGAAGGSGSSGGGGGFPGFGFGGSFASGGSFEVGGKSGVDRNLVAFRATKGEQVTVTPSGKGGGQGLVFAATINVDMSNSALEGDFVGTIQQGVGEQLRASERRMREFVTRGAS